jgi:chloramphenicol 3-O-phosphotransferase
VEDRIQRLLDDITLESCGQVARVRIDDRTQAEGADDLTRVADAPGRRVTSVAVNGRRVDVVVLAGPAQEWRVVLEVDDDCLRSVVVFERPPRFVGVDGGRAVIVNGPSSAGKSTVMSAVLKASSTPWVMFDELFFGTVAMPFLIWGDAAPTLRQGFIAGIQALAAAGNQVIMTGGDPDEFLQLRAHVPALAVGLDCPLEERIARQAARSDRWGGLTEATEDRPVGWSYDIRFDTSLVSPPEIAARILQAVDEL